MKIVLCTQLFSPAIYGGGEIVFYNISKELAKRGYDVTVVTQNLIGIKSYEKKSGVKIFRVGAPIKYKGLLPLSFFHNLSFLIASFFKILKLKPDLIHSNTYTPSISSQLASKILRKPHVMTVHDVYFAKKDSFWKKWGEQQSTSLFSKFFGKFVEKIVLNMNVSCIHTVSDTSKKDIEKVNNKNIVTVVPNGIDLDDYKLKKTNRDLCRIVFLGRLVFYKNLDVVLDALVNNPKVKLSVIGDGPKKNEWKKLAVKLKVDTRVDFLGRVSDELKKEVLSTSAALVLPSEIEGFGLSLIEAMALGTPCIISDVKPLTEIIKDGFNGLVVKNHGWDRAINKLCNNKELFQKLSKNAFESSKKYSISTTVSELIKKVYAKINL